MTTRPRVQVKLHTVKTRPRVQVKLSHRADGPSKNGESKRLRILNYCDSSLSTDKNFSLAFLITLYFTIGKVNGKANSMLEKTVQLIKPNTLT